MHGTLQFPTGVIGWEISFTVAYAILETGRIYKGYQGNLAENTGAMVVFLIFCLLVGAGNFYFFQMQVFVLRLDQILGYTSFVFIGLEFFIGVLATVKFAGAL